LKQDVGGLDVAVNDLVPMRVIQCVGDRGCNPHRLVDR
jgi:hypothetical protein